MEITKKLDKTEENGFKYAKRRHLRKIKRSNKQELAGKKIFEKSRIDNLNIKKKLIILIILIKDVKSMKIPRFKKKHKKEKHVSWVNK